MIIWIDRILANDSLTEQDRVRKRYAWIWLVISFTGIIGMLFLGYYYKMYPMLWYAYLMNGGMLAAIILFPLVANWRQVLMLDLVFNTILNFVILLQIGGLESSLGFVFNGINNLMASFLIGNRKWTVGLMIAWVMSIAITGFMSPYLTTPDYITPTINLIFFVIDTSWVMPTILILVLFFWQDQTRLERAEAEKLRQLDEAKTKLYTHISHEFRTPLTLIQGISHQMQKDPGRWKSKGPAQIYTQSRILLKLVNQMLDIAKVEARSMHINMIHGDLRKFIQYLTGLFQGLADSKRISLTFVSDEDCLFTDYDPEKLMQILDNLITNAIKFTGETGSITVTLRCDMQSPTFAAIDVRDNGRGIPEDALPHVFDRFYQVPDAEQQTQGTGLGLALTKELVKLMNGYITVTSTPGKGSVFTVFLPISAAAETEADAGISAIQDIQITEAADYPDLTTDQLFNYPCSAQLPVLLIVEDNADVIEFLSSILKDNYNIITAGDGAEGLHIATGIIPDLILTDIMMPGMDGFEFVRRLKADERTDHIPIVVLTAMGDEQSKLAGLELGADHFLVKPFHEEELLLKLHNLLECRRAMQKKLGVIRWDQNRETGAGYRLELQFISRVNRILDERFSDESFDISEICANVNMSRAQFYRKFAALTNQSIGHYLRTFRLHKAAEMIANRGLNVTEAALESGFRNVSHFSKSFKEEFGYAPSRLVLSSSGTS